MNKKIFIVFLILALTVCLLSFASAADCQHEWLYLFEYELYTNGDATDRDSYSFGTREYKYCTLCGYNRDAAPNEYDSDVLWNLVSTQHRDGCQKYGLYSATPYNYTAMPFPENYSIDIVAEDTWFYDGQWDTYNSPYLVSHNTSGNTHTNYYGAYRRCTYCDFNWGTVEGITSQSCGRTHKSTVTQHMTDGAEAFAGDETKFHYNYTVDRYTCDYCSEEIIEQSIEGCCYDYDESGIVQNEQRQFGYWTIISCSECGVADRSFTVLDVDMETFLLVGTDDYGERGRTGQYIYKGDTEQYFTIPNNNWNIISYCRSQQPTYANRHAYLFAKLEDVASGVFNKYYIYYSTGKFDVPVGSIVYVNYTDYFGVLDIKEAGKQTVIPAMNFVYKDGKYYGDGKELKGSFASSTKSFYKHSWQRTQFFDLTSFDYDFYKANDTFGYIYLTDIDGDGQYDYSYYDAYIKVKYLDSDMSGDKGLFTQFYAATSPDSTAYSSGWLGGTKGNIVNMSPYSLVDGGYYYVQARMYYAPNITTASGAFNYCLYTPYGNSTGDVSRFLTLTPATGFDSTKYASNYVPTEQELLVHLNHGGTRKYLFRDMYSIENKSKTIVVKYDGLTARKIFTWDESSLTDNYLDGYEAGRIAALLDNGSYFRSFIEGTWFVIVDGVSIITNGVTVQGTPLSYYLNSLLVVVIVGFLALVALKVFKG